MARHQAPETTEFAKLVAEAIDREAGAHRWSGRELARRLGKSEGYVRERRNRKYEWTLNDIEDFCLAIGMQPDAFIARIEADEVFRARFEERPAEVVPPLAPVTQLRPDVGALDEDELAEHYDELAANRDRSDERLDPDQA